MDIPITVELRYTASTNCSWLLFFFYYFVSSETETFFAFAFTLFLDSSFDFILLLL